MLCHDFNNLSAVKLSLNAYQHLSRNLNNDFRIGRKIIFLTAESVVTTPGFLERSALWL
jgi:hypothetical protein